MSSAKNSSSSLISSPSISNTLDFTDLEKKTQGSLVVSNKPSMPTWVPDNEVSSCMLCDKSFTVFSRKHHCRNCGFVICKACSSTRATLSQTPARVRVCDRCVTDLDISKSSSTIVVDDDDLILPTNTERRNSLSSSSPSSAHTESTVHHMLTKDVSNTGSSSSQLLGVIDVPAWSYAFKPFAKHGANIRVGRAMIKLTSVNNIPLPPNMQSFENTTLSSMLRIGDSSLPSTRVVVRKGDIPHSITADINQDFILDVSSASQSIRIQLAQHVGSMTLPLGFVNIPVSSLDHQQHVTLTLPLEGTFRTVANAQLPTITIDAQYLFNVSGHFWSQFATEPVSIPTRPFMLATFLRDLMFAVYHCRMLSSSMYVIDMLISWSLPVLSLFAITTLIFGLHYSKAFLIILHIFIWRYFILQYRKLSVVVTDTQPQEGQSLQPYHIEQLASLCPGSNEDVSLTGTVQSVTDMQLSELMQDFLEQMLPLCGMGSLTECDRGLYLINSTIRYYTQFINWERPVFTASFFILSLISFVYLFNDQRYVWSAIGVALFTCKAPLALTLSTLITSLSKGNKAKV